MIILQTSANQKSTNSRPHPSLLSPIGSGDVGQKNTFDCNLFGTGFGFQKQREDAPGWENILISSLTCHFWTLDFPSLWIYFKQQTVSPFFLLRAWMQFTVPVLAENPTTSESYTCFPCLSALYSDGLTTYMWVTYRLVLPAVHHGNRNHVPYKKLSLDWDCCKYMWGSLSWCWLSPPTSNDKLIITNSINDCLESSLVNYHGKKKRNWTIQGKGLGLKLTNYIVQKGNSS